jgi:ribosomal protein L15
MKTIKRKKVSRMHGKGMGTHGTGARKNKRKSGNHGGSGLSGSGKRADHKKTLVLKLYGHEYFGKKGITSRGTKKDKRKRINVGEIQLNLEKYSKKNKEGYEVLLKDYIFLTCFEASKTAIEKIEAAGGKIILKEKKKIETPLVEFNKKK